MAKKAFLQNSVGMPEHEVAEENGKRIYFDSSATLVSVLAGEIQENLSVAADRLGVGLVSRDNWIALTASDPEKLRSAETFF